MRKKRIIIIMIVLFIAISSIKKVYAGDYDETEYDEVYVPGGGMQVTPTPPTPTDANQNQIDNVTYIDRTKITGKIVESVEANEKQNVGGLVNNIIHDSSKNIYDKGIPNLKVELYVDGKYKSTTTTSADGEYEFSDLGLIGKHNYYMKYSYPNVTVNEIDSIRNIQQAKSVQEKLRINGQDYHVLTDSKTSTIEKYGKGIAQVMILLDCSKSMKNSVVTFADGSTITKLELEKQIASKLVEDLLEYDRNIVIGLVVFNGQVYRKVSLTSNKQVLLDAINGNIEFTSFGYTNVYGALDKAYYSFANNDRNTSNRYIFLLSDGLPTSDGSKQNQVYKVPTDPNLATMVRNINEVALKNIANNTSEIIKKLEDDGISIFSAIATEGLSQEGMRKLNEIYKDNKDANYNYYETVNSIEDLQGSVFIKNLKKFVRDSIKVVDTNYTIDKSTRGNNIKNEYQQFKYENTEYFEALDMNIQNNIDINTFKKYAKRLLKKTQVQITTPTNQAVFQYGNLPNPPQRTYYNPDGTVDYIEYYQLRDIEINAPKSILEKLPPFTLVPKITSTKATMVNSIENILKQRFLEVNSEEDRKQDLYIEIEGKEIYGGNLIVEYTVDLINQSIFNNTINNVECIVYLDKGFRYYEKAGLKATIVDGTNIEKRLDIEARELNDIILEQYKKNGYLPKEYEGEIEKYFNNNGTAIIVRIKNNQGYKIPTNAKIQVKVSAIKLISGDEPDNGYNVDSEISSYSNDAYRRLMYNNNLSNSFSGLDGAVAANKDSNEKDYVSSNRTVILTPTGVNKNLNEIRIIICVLVLAGIIVILHRKRSNIIS